MNCGSRRRVRPTIRHLAPLADCACVFEEWIYGGQEVPKSLELAQLWLWKLSSFLLSRVNQRYFSKLYFILFVRTIQDTYAISSESIIPSTCRTVANTCCVYVNFNNINSTKSSWPLLIFLLCISELLWLCRVVGLKSLLVHSFNALIIQILRGCLQSLFNTDRSKAVLLLLFLTVTCFLLSVFILWVTYYVSEWVLSLGSWMTNCLGKSCSFGLPRVPFVNCCQLCI